MTDSKKNNNIHPAWRGKYSGLLEAEKSLGVATGKPDRERDLTANWLLHRTFGLGGSENDFKSFWGDKFKWLSGQGLTGHIQLKFPDVPLSDLLELTVRLTRQLLGENEAQVIYNYYKQHFSPKYLADAKTDEPDVTNLVLRSVPAYDGADDLLFGLVKSGMPYDDKYAENGEQTQQKLLEHLVSELSQSKPDLNFDAMTIRQWVISLLLDLVEQVEDPASEKTLRVRPGFALRDMSGRSADGIVPGVYLDGDRDVDLDGGGGGGNSDYGFGVLAVEKT